MADLLLDPYLLIQGQMIEARIIAVNEIGESTPSIVNNAGDLIESVPHKPLNVPSKNFLTTQIELVVDFEHLTGELEGASPILSYSVEWNQGESVNEFVELQNNMLSQVIVSSGIIGG